MRWGILWRPLQFRLARNIKVIDAAVRLHNFIVSRREDDENLSVEFDGYPQESLEFLLDNSFEEIGVLNASSVTDEWGRLPLVEEANRNVGKNTREYIKETLKRNGHKRPSLSTGAAWYRDKFNRVNNLENP